MSGLSEVLSHYSLSLFGCSYNDIGENNRLRVFSLNNARVPLPFLTRERNGTIPIGDPVISQQDREEDFPKNRADSDAVTYYFFAAVFPVAVILTVLHLILHAVPVLGLIISLAVSYWCAHGEGQF